jgi:hypothetical protein
MGSEVLPSVFEGLEGEAFNLSAGAMLAIH